MTPQQTLVLQGSHTVRHAAETYASFTAAMSAPGDILLDCAGVTEADISFIQIILAATRSAVAQGKQLRLTAPPEAALCSALERAGFAQRPTADPASWLKHGSLT